MTEYSPSLRQTNLAKKKLEHDIQTLVREFEENHWPCRVTKVNSFEGYRRYIRIEITIGRNP